MLQLFMACLFRVSNKLLHVSLCVHLFLFLFQERLVFAHCLLLLDSFHWVQRCTEIKLGKIDLIRTMNVARQWNWIGLDHSPGLMVYLVPKLIALPPPGVVLYSRPMPPSCSSCQCPSWGIPWPILKEKLFSREMSQEFIAVALEGYDRALDQGGGHREKLARWEVYLEDLGFKIHPVKTAER